MALGAKNPELFKTTAYKTVKVGKEMPRQRTGGLGTPGGAPVGKPTPTPDMKRVAVETPRGPLAAGSKNPVKTKGKASNQGARIAATKAKIAKLRKDGLG